MPEATIFIKPTLISQQNKLVCSFTVNHKVPVPRMHPGFCLELEVRLSHVDGPGKLLPLGFIVDLFYRYLHVLTPGHTDAWVQVVELGGAERDLLVLLSVRGLDLHLQQLLLTALHRRLLPLHQAEDTDTQSLHCCGSERRRLVRPARVSNVLTSAAWGQSCLCFWRPSWPASALSWPEPAAPFWRRSGAGNRKQQLPHHHTDKIKSLNNGSQ